MATNKLGPPLPNLTHLCRCLIAYIANHPLVINPIVAHPLSGDAIPINAYRTFDGYEVRNGLTCSVFPYPGAGGGIPSPQSTSTSAWFKPHELGQEGVDEAHFNIVIKYSFNETILGKTVTFEVPTSATFGPGQKLLTSNTKKDVILEVNPGIEIIQNYLAITKVIIDDIVHKRDFPIAAKSFELLHYNVKSKRWEEDDTVYFQEGVAMTLFQAYMARGWRDNILPLYARTTPNINPTIN